MKPIFVLLATSVALLSGCVVVPDHDEHRAAGYYGGDGRVDHDRDHYDRDRDDHRDNGGDRDRWQGGQRY